MPCQRSSSIRAAFRSSSRMSGISRVLHHSHGSDHLFQCVQWASTLHRTPTLPSYRDTVTVPQRCALLALAFILSLASSHGAMAHDAGEDVARYRAQLGDRSAAVRWKAITALAAAGQEAITLLTTGLHDTSVYVRTGSAIALGRMGTAARTAEPVLAQALADSSARVREEASVALGMISSGDERTISALARCLSDPDPFVAGKSAGALASIGTPALPALLGVLRGSDHGARTAAANALGKTGPQRPRRHQR